MMRHLRSASVPVLALLFSLFFFLGKYSSVQAEAASIVSSEVVIYGATPAGIMAAVALKRAGHRVELLDPLHHIGGMVTSGLSGSDICKHQYIGGLSREFFRLVGREYGRELSWRFEPKVASKVFTDILKSHRIVPRLGQGLKEVKVERESSSEPKIKEVITFSGTEYQADYFIDATYEGDLLAAAGVSFHLGREGRAKYGELLAGINLSSTPPRHNWGVELSPYGKKGEILPHISTSSLPAVGSEDWRLPAYNFRLILTTKADNQIRFEKPPKYDPYEFELLARFLESRPGITVDDIFTVLPIGHEKFDLNNRGPFSSNLIGGGFSYPVGDQVKREEIWQEHKRYTKALLYFLSSSERVPDRIRQVVNTWGYAKDEFLNNDNWPPQLYVRVGRRLIGEYVLTHSDTRHTIQKEDSVGIATCPIESHHVQRVIISGKVVNEGYVDGKVRPYQIPFRSLIPKREEMTNLIVPVAVSASHIAYTSLRMEPVFMILGESAGHAVALALQKKEALQDIDRQELRARLLDAGQVLGDFRERSKDESYQEVIKHLGEKGVTVIKAPYRVAYNLEKQLEQLPSGAPEIKIVSLQPIENDPYLENRLAIRQHFGQEGESLLPILVPRRMEEIIERSFVVQGISYKKLPLASLTLFSELKFIHQSRVPIPREEIEASSSHNPTELDLLLDGDLSTRWGSGVPQAPEMKLTFRFRSPKQIKSIDYALSKWRHDAPVALEIVALDSDGQGQREIVKREDYRAALLTVYSHEDRFRFDFAASEVVAIELRQLGAHRALDWSVAELVFYE